MKRLVILLAVVGVLLTGCASKWCHATKGPQEFEQDKYDCTMKTRSGSAEMMLVDFDHRINCLKFEKGWYKCRD